ncbi:Ula1p NDAI_0C06290 [Naumovozyma dairenensis CBS 421]|uniref:NEDD8-activating enzyme E1 regulatory subunit n=1 Tax=Naumovozyma dairenensis (strain ATCC 10597 / BCRC 20456 / CBS 421 / NBRC 0211 / NRRL Y-12639) TaxID=1071378 RepID=G0W927_NAUDC|nr:hypothetical protein NDAI_0C06290 [Naumovozyma dairenensis CBS 421]CCD24288.1 hypothetical protein NDAI_0C06290 [Naumovozyma dairenensis CBS 421]
MDRYDRQLRLWGHGGQALLTKSTVCLIGPNSCLLQEIWKILVLAGQRNFIWVIEDGNEIDDNQFFYDDIVRDLSALHPQGIIVEKKESLCDIEWVKLSVVILANSSNKYYLETLSMEEVKLHLPPVFTAYVHGMVGYLHLSLSEPYFVMESHPDNVVPELRLDKPWPELVKYMESFDLKSMDEYSLAKLPYPVILYHAIIYIKEIMGINPATLTSSQFRGYLTHYIHELSPGNVNDLNFIEAKRFSYLALPNPTLQKKLESVIDYAKQSYNLCTDEYNRNVSILLQTLEIYLKENANNHYPLPARIPDMESSTEEFNKIKMVYEGENMKSLDRLMELLQENKYDIPKSLLEVFCDNIKNIQYQEPSTYSIERSLFNTSNRLLRDLLELQYGSANNIKMDEHMEKVLSLNSYPTSTFIGGVVAQETIKLITHQYIPINNTFLFDASKNESTILRL